MSSTQSRMNSGWKRAITRALGFYPRSSRRWTFNAFVKRNAWLSWAMNTALSWASGRRKSPNLSGIRRRCALLIFFVFLKNVLDFCRARDAKHREIFEKTFVELKRQREERERTSRVDRTRITLNASSGGSGSGPSAVFDANNGDVGPCFFKIYLLFTYTTVFIKKQIF